MLLSHNRQSKLLERGFLVNIKRGTAYFYGKQAVKNFCANNSIDLIVRGHEVFPNGIRFFVHGQVISVFSSSRYMNNDNSASILFLCQNRIRVIRIALD